MHMSVSIETVLNVHIILFFLQMFDELLKVFEASSTSKQTSLKGKVKVDVDVTPTSPQCEASPFVDWPSVLNASTEKAQQHAGQRFIRVWKISNLHRMLIIYLNKLFLFQAMHVKLSVFLACICSHMLPRL